MPYFQDHVLNHGDWCPTHEIQHDGRAVFVQLHEGSAYTLDEWQSSTSADYERQDDGSWTFQGQPFNGTVRRLPTAME